MLRMMVKNQIAVSFIPEVLVKMRIGGKSNRSWRNRRQANIEDALAWKLNGLRTPPLLRLTKPLRKVGQFFRKPSSRSRVTRRRRRGIVCSLERSCFFAHGIVEMNLACIVGGNAQTL